MSKLSERRKSDHAVLVWWGTMGVGLGLVALALVVDLQQTRQARDANPLVAQAHQMAPLLKQLRQGHAPSPELVQHAQGTVLAPLMQSLLDADRQRRQALMAYQTQVEAVALGNWLVPANLVSKTGRAQVRQHLDDLRAALDGLVRRDAAVHARLDEALLDWSQQIPAAKNSPWRHELLASTGATAKAMSTFFKVEQDIVSKVESLLTRLDRAGPGVSLEGGPSSQELVFVNRDDLAFYQATLNDLNELGHQEQQWLVAAEQASGHHARQVGDLLTATLNGVD